MEKEKKDENNKGSSKLIDLMYLTNPNILNKIKNFNKKEQYSKAELKSKKKIILKITEDIIMGKQSRDRFPYSIECKNQERVNVWQSYDQAKTNCKGYEPLLVIKRNRSKPLVVMDAEHFVSLFKGEDDDA